MADSRFTPEEREVLTRAFGLLAYASGYVIRPARKEEFRRAAVELAEVLGVTVSESSLTLEKCK